MSPECATVQVRCVTYNIIILLYIRKTGGVQLKLTYRYFSGVYGGQLEMQLYVLV